MKLIALDASTWTSPDDVFSALFVSLGSPAWHGRNLNALDDSLIGGINAVEPPFRVVVNGAGALAPDLTEFLAEVADVFAGARKAYGRDVWFEVADSMH